MPVFHFTLHAYRSWNADHPRGYIQRGEQGIKARNVGLARARERLAKFDEVIFDAGDQAFLVEETQNVVRRRGWTPYGVTAMEGHLHLVAGWKGDDVDEEFVQTRLKRAFGFLLAKRHVTTGKPYFSRGGVPERVKDKAHLRYLLYEYFPKHHSVMWRVELE